MDPEQPKKPADEAHGGPIRTLLLVGIVAAAAAFMVSASHEFSKDRIAANERARLIASLNSVLDPDVRSHDLATVRLTVTDPDLLGSDAPVEVFVALDAGAPAAVVFASAAPHGYNAAIRMLIGVSPTGTLTGVRVVSHRETPGLGDAIEVEKSPWITQFDGKSLTAPAAALWAVSKDDGAFDTITGATVTSRAVVRGVKNTLLYFDMHHDELFAAAASSQRNDGNNGNDGTR
jgi:electron transport complex protein RnfG